MNSKEMKVYRRYSMLGALGALLMLAGDLCLSIIPVSAGDSGLFVREAYLNGSYESWRLPLLIATGLPCMALGFFFRADFPSADKSAVSQNALCSSYRRRNLHSHSRSIAFIYRQSCRLDKYTGTAFRA